MTQPTLSLPDAARIEDAARKLWELDTPTLPASMYRGETWERLLQAAEERAPYAITYLKKYRHKAAVALDVAHTEIARLGELHDAQMLRVKACEHIAEGGEGWEVLRHECPSIEAVAKLRDELARLRAPAGDAMEVSAETVEAASRAFVQSWGGDPDAPFLASSAMPHPSMWQSYAGAVRAALGAVMPAAITAAEARATQADRDALSTARILPEQAAPLTQESPKGARELRDSATYEAGVRQGIEMAAQVVAALLRVNTAGVAYNCDWNDAIEMAESGVRALLPPAPEGGEGVTAIKAPSI